MLYQPLSVSANGGPDQSKKADQRNVKVRRRDVGFVCFQAEMIFADSEESMRTTTVSTTRTPQNTLS